VADRVTRVQGLRSSGAAGPHKGRDPREPLTKAEAIEEQVPDVVRHNHITRDIKPLGQCPACDRIHEHWESNA
jgi:hypothetical protein